MDFGRLAGLNERIAAVKAAFLFIGDTAVCEKK